ncbi:MAG: methionyl-tRNA formyltransferase [Parcubacteria bacterium C7867-001]|nr:MAG: methionyl-tRNA formyltransferase [Parcubacteria bacterium C7867-001]
MSAIVQKGDPVLREIAKPVPEQMFGSSELAEIIRDMKETLDKEPDGVALAAPQIAISYRIFIVRYDRMRPPPENDRPEVPEYGVFINPKIVKSSRRRIPMDEGCLSVRGTYGTTLRHDRATVRAQDENGKKFERGGGDILAQAFQHEIDHLDGTLFVDHAEELYAPSGRTSARKKFLFFGTPYVARDTLALLLERGMRPEAVITSPDAPRGRGMELLPSDTKAFAVEHGIPVLTPEKLTPSVIEELKAFECEYALVVAYGKILPQKLIDAFPLGILNVHYSLLPKYRGASPVEAALLHGETVTGVTVQKMVKELDAGDVLGLVEVEIGPEETTRELRPRLITIGAELLADILPAFEQDLIEGEAQDASHATHCGKIAKEEGLLDLSGDAQTNWNKYRAYAESPGTYFFMQKNGKDIRVKIKTAKFENRVFTPLRIVPEGKTETDYATFAK